MIDVGRSYGIGSHLQTSVLSRLLVLSISPSIPVTWGDQCPCTVCHTILVSLSYLTSLIKLTTHMTIHNKMYC